MGRAGQGEACRPARQRHAAPSSAAHPECMPKNFARPATDHTRRHGACIITHTPDLRLRGSRAARSKEITHTNASRPARPASASFRRCLLLFGDHIALLSSPKPHATGSRTAYTALVPGMRSDTPVHTPFDLLTPARRCLASSGRPRVCAPSVPVIPSTHAHTHTHTTWRRGALERNRSTMPGLPRLHSRQQSISQTGRLGPLGHSVVCWVV